MLQSRCWWILNIPGICHPLGGNPCSSSNQSEGMTSGKEIQMEKPSSAPCADTLCCLRMPNHVAHVLFLLLLHPCSEQIMAQTAFCPPSVFKQSSNFVWLFLLNFVKMWLQRPVWPLQTELWNNPIIDQSCTAYSQITQLEREREREKKVVLFESLHRKQECSRVKEHSLSTAEVPSCCGAHTQNQVVEVLLIIKEIHMLQD